MYTLSLSLSLPPSLSLALSRSLSLSLCIYLLQTTAPRPWSRKEFSKSQCPSNFSE